MCLADPNRDYITYNEDGTQNREGERYIELSPGGGLGMGVRNEEAQRRYDAIKDDPIAMEKQKEINRRVIQSHALEGKWGQQVHGRPVPRQVEDERERGVDESTGPKQGRQDTNRKKKALEVKKEKRGQKKLTSMGAETVPNTPSSGINTP